jgi:hypothetical protein
VRVVPDPLALLSAFCAAGQPAQNKWVLGAAAPQAENIWWPTRSREGERAERAKPELSKAEN